MSLHSYFRPNGGQDRPERAVDPVPLSSHVNVGAVPPTESDDTPLDAMVLETQFNVAEEIMVDKEVSFVHTSAEKVHLAFSPCLSSRPQKIFGN